MTPPVSRSGVMVAVGIASAIALFCLIMFITGVMSADSSNPAYQSSRPATIAPGALSAMDPLVDGAAVENEPRLSDTEFVDIHRKVAGIVDAVAPLAPSRDALVPIVGQSITDDLIARAGEAARSMPPGAKVSPGAVDLSKKGEQITARVPLYYSGSSGGSASGSINVDLARDRADAFQVVAVALNVSASSDAIVP